MALDAAQQESRHQPATRAVGGILSIDALDKRTRAFKRYQVIVGAVLADTGGVENVSEIQRQLIAKFATLALQLEAMEAAAIEGNEIDLDLFGRCAGHLRRIAEALGLKRVPREIPTLEEHLARIARERPPDKDKDAQTDETENASAA
jgi:hypothetical protein